MNRERLEELQRLGYTNMTLVEAEMVLDIMHDITIQNLAWGIVYKEPKVEYVNKSDAALREKLKNNQSS